MYTFQTHRLYLFSSSRFSKLFAAHHDWLPYMPSVQLVNRFFSCLANVLKNNVLILFRILRFNFTLLASPVNKLPWMLIFPLAFQNLMKVLCHSPARGSFQPRCGNAVGSHVGSSRLLHRKICDSVHIFGAKEIYEEGSGGECYSRKMEAGGMVAGKMLPCLCFPCGRPNSWERERRKNCCFSVAKAYLEAPLFIRHSHFPSF